MTIRRLVLAWIMAVFVCAGVAHAQTPRLPFQILGGFGNDGCRGGPGWDISSSTPVQHSSGQVQCFQGFGEISSSAGPGVLTTDGTVTHQGFGTGSGMGPAARFRAQFTLSSATDAPVAISLNLVLATTGSTSGGLFRSDVRARLDQVDFHYGRVTQDGTNGGVPPANGVATAFTTSTVMVTPNVPHELEVELDSGVGASSLDTWATISSRLTLAAAGPVINLPAGVTVSDMPELAITNNRWVGPPFVVDGNTTQAMLDALIDLQGSFLMNDVAGRATLTLPNLATVGCDFTVTNNPDLTSLSAPALGAVGCDIDVSHNPALDDVVLETTGVIGGTVTITDNSNASNIELTSTGVIGGTVTITDNSNASHIEVGGQGVLGGSIVIGGNGGDIDVSVSSSVGDSIEINNNSGSEAIDVSVGSSVGDGITINNNSGADAVDVNVGTSVGGGVTVVDNSGANRVDVNVGTSVGNNVTVEDNSAANTVDINVGTTIGGSVTVKENDSADTIEIESGSGIGQDVTVADNSAASSVDIVSGGGIGGTVTVSDNGAGDVDLTVSGGHIGGDVIVTDNSEADSIDLKVDGGVIGDVVVVDNGNASVDVDTPSIGGDLTASVGGDQVSATTADGTTVVTMVNGPATMTVELPTGTFTRGVAFSIDALGDQPASAGTDASQRPAMIEALTAYQFTFDIPTLNHDATLTFEIDVVALGNQGAAFLTALNANLATLAVRGDAQGNAFQAFNVCAGAATPSAGGCVRVERLDANGNPMAAGNPARARFTGVTGHFSSFAVVLVSIIDVTAPVISNVPANMNVTATGSGGAAATYSNPVALDDRDGNVAVSCLPASGATFAIGATTVRCAAQDAAGNRSEATFTVTVTAPAPPPAPPPPKGGKGAVDPLTLLFGLLAIASVIAQARRRLRGRSGTF